MPTPEIQYELLAVAVSIAMLAIAILLPPRQPKPSESLAVIEPEPAAETVETAESLTLNTELGIQVQQLGLRVRELAHIIESMREGPVRTGPRAAANPDLQRAAQLARSGALPDSLSESCDLSPGEAALVARMHGQRKAS